MKLVFEANNAKELIGQMENFLSAIGGKEKITVVTPAAQETAFVEEAAPKPHAGVRADVPQAGIGVKASSAPVGTAKRPGRPPKNPRTPLEQEEVGVYTGPVTTPAPAADFLDVAPAAVAAPSAPAAPAAKSSAVKFTKEHVTAALQAVNSKKGINTARAVLAQFGQERLSSLPEDQYEAFMEACHKVVG